MVNLTKKTMKQFKDFNIEKTDKMFSGEKIKMSKILNRSIIIHDYKIEPTKIEANKNKGNGKCLYLQIGLGDISHVVFTGATKLMETITKIPKTELPFATTIIEENERFEFT